MVTCDLGVVGDADAADAVVPRRRYLARTPRAVAATHEVVDTVNTTTSCDTNMSPKYKYILINL